MTEPEPEPPRIGELLICTAGAGAGFFDQSVALLLEADEAGVIGVVLNKTTPAVLDEILPAWADLVSVPQLLFAGGPVSPQGAICLARLADPQEEPPGWRRVIGDLGLLHLNTPVELVRGAFSHLRVFAGYAGWTAGQLEGELESGLWYRSTPHWQDVFSCDPHLLWRQVLRRQRGARAMMSTWTPTPGLN